MDLFAELLTDPSINHLTQDGTVNYYGEIFSPTQADDCFSKLLQETAWQYDQALIRGKLITTNRRVAWYGNQSYPYTYSGTTKQALPWTETLLALKSFVEEKTGARYNSCLVNLYDDGNTGMAWHSDNEGLLVEDAAIASISFGAERRFLLRHKTTQQTIEFTLTHGSLLVMKDQTQRYWLHSLPKMARVKEARINLTFRVIKEKGFTTPPK